MNYNNSNDGTNRRRFLASAAGITTAAVAGCTGNGEETGDEGAVDISADGNTLRWGGSVPVQGLDPHLDTAAASWEVFENITEGLTKVNWDFEIEPWLASDWEISDDNQQLTFDLRQGVQFHDGTEFTADDVLASFERIANGDYLATEYFDFVDSMEAVDDHTFEMVMNEPFAPILNRMSTNSMHILPADVAESDDFDDQLIGTGPFQFEDWSVESEFVMTAFDDYWQDEYPQVDEVVKDEIPDGDTRLDRFRAGEVDFIDDVPAREIETLENDPDIEYSEVFPRVLYYLGLNASEEPFDDRHARIALEFAFDRNDVIEAALYGNGQVPNSPGFPDSQWAHPDLEPRGHDLEAAQEHLEQSDYPDGFEATFQIPSDYDPAVSAGQIIAEQAAEVGIDLDIQQITWSSWLSDVFDSQDFQATISTYLGGWYPDFAYFDFLHPDGNLYFTGWDDDEYNAQVEDARSILDDAERAAAYHEAAEMIKEKRSGHVLLFWQGYQMASTPELQGQLGAPDGATYRFWDNHFE